MELIKKLFQKREDLKSKSLIVEKSLKLSESGDFYKIEFTLHNNIPFIAFIAKRYLKAINFDVNLENPILFFSSRNVFLNYLLTGNRFPKLSMLEEDYSFLIIRNDKKYLIEIKLENKEIKYLIMLLSEDDKNIYSLDNYTRDQNHVFPFYSGVNLK